MHHRHLCSKDCGRRPPPLQLPGAVHGILWPWNSPTTPCIVRLRHRRKSRSWSAVSGPRVCELEGTRGASPTLWVRAGCPALCVSPSRTLPNPPLPSLRLAALQRRGRVRACLRGSARTCTTLCMCRTARCSVWVSARCADSGLFVLCLSALTQAPCDFLFFPLPTPHQTRLRHAASWRNEHAWYIALRRIHGL
jgi:hypothetical protein